MAFQITIDTPLPNATITIPIGSTTVAVPTSGTYELRFKDKATAIEVVMSNGTHTYKGNPTPSGGNWTWPFPAVAAGLDYVITATLTEDNNTTSDAVENIDVLAADNQLVTIDPARINAVASDTMTVTGTVKLLFAHFMIVTMSRISRRRQDRVLSTQAFPVVSTQWAATMTVPPGTPKNTRILLHAVVMNSQGVVKGKAVADYGTIS